MRFHELRGGDDEVLDGYAVVRERGVFEPEGAFAIEHFVVPDGDMRFVGLWEAEQDALAAHRGWLGAQLLQGPDWVGVTRWSSPLMHQRALGPGGPALYRAA